MDNFIISLYNKCKTLQELLTKILKDEELLENNILVKSGFIIRRYSLRLSAVNKETLLQLHSELENTKILENQIFYYYKPIQNDLAEIEKAYYAYKKEKIPIRQIFTQYMNNALSMVNLSLVKAGELLQMLEKGATIHKEDSGGEVHKVLKSLEKMTTQILQFINLLGQVVKKVVEFERESYYPSPRMYGRVMSDREYKKMKESNSLSSRQDPTPVFDSSRDITTKILGMSKDKREEFFSAIGVRSIQNLVFFQTKLKPVIGPVPQSNGLREYKFPAGTPVEMLQAA